MRVIEGQMTGGGHSEFNKAFLKILQKNSKDKIFIYAEKKHLDILQEEIKDEYSVPIDIKNFGKNKINLIKNELNFLKIIFCTIRKFKGEEIIFLSISPITSYLLGKFTNLFKKNKIKIVLHAELNSLVENLKPWNKNSWIKNSLYVNQKNDVEYIVLGKSIKDNLEKVIKLENKVTAITHPYNYQTNLNDKKNKISGEKLSIGTIGIAAISKGTDQLTKLAEKTDSNKVTYSVVGSVDSNLANILNKYDNIIFEIEKFYSRAEYEKKVSELNYVLFLYPSDTYKLGASGAVFDAIKFEKPIIAIRNDYFNFLFTEYGEFGYLFDTMDELISFVKKLTEKNDERIYLEKVNLIKEVKKKLENE